MNSPRALNFHHHNYLTRLHLSVCPSFHLNYNCLKPTSFTKTSTWIKQRERPNIEYVCLIYHILFSFDHKSNTSLVIFKMLTIPKNWGKSVNAHLTKDDHSWDFDTSPPRPFLYAYKVQCWLFPPQRLYELCSGESTVLLFLITSFCVLIFYSKQLLVYVGAPMRVSPKEMPGKSLLSNVLKTLNA